MIGEKINKSLIIYTPLITNRLKYIFDFILNQELGLDYELCNDKRFFNKSTNYKFSYSSDNYYPQLPYIQSHGILQSEEIRETNIDVFIFENQKAFFKSGKPSFFPFDIFAASFYLISRYEEYLPYQTDSHGRFPANLSLAFKEGFLEEPLINIWINLFKINLLKEFPELCFKNRQFKYLSTIDIDNAYADLNKGLLRTSLSLSKLLLTLKIKPLFEKIQILRNIKKDPYDNYDYLDEIHKKYQIDPIYFILFSKYGNYDKNLLQNNPAFIKLIKRISVSYEIGLHPSYRSNKSLQILNSEKKMLEKIIDKSITNSRQHFLKLQLPTTYENLNEININKDFSMGFASMPGFRASVCSPFKFFNLIKNCETGLQVVPFAVMDACYIHYLKIKPEIALKNIKKIITSVKKVNGLFVSLWHNESLSLRKGEISWRKIFEQMLEEANHGN